MSDAVECEVSPTNYRRQVTGERGCLAYIKYDTVAQLVERLILDQ